MCARFLRWLIFSLALVTDHSWGANTRIYTVKEDATVQYLRGHSLSPHWSLIISDQSEGSNSLLLFYNRQTGKGKTARLTERGYTTDLQTYAWQTEWDMIRFGKYGNANCIFYRRSDGFLAAFQFDVDGNMHFRWSQTIADPLGSESIYRSGWDMVMPGNWLYNEQSGLLFYHRASGQIAFYEYDSRLRNFTLIKRQFHWQDVWDVMTVGDFNNDSIDDIVGYDQDSGELRIFFIDRNLEVTGQPMLRNPGRSHGARLIAGDFSGFSGDDIVLYQQESRFLSPKGRTTLWADLQEGLMSEILLQDSIPNDWTHMIPLPGGVSPGFLFYTNQQTVEVVLSQAVSSGPERFARWTRSDIRNIQNLLKSMNRTYASAGLFFKLKRRSRVVVSEVLANWQCGGFHDLQEANREIREIFPESVIPIVMAMDSSDLAGCSDLGFDFIRVGKELAIEQKHYAHEMGHFLGLPHPHLPSKSSAQLGDFFVGFNHGENPDLAKGFADSDGQPDQRFYPILDTAPTLRPEIFQEYGIARCQNEKLNFEINGLVHSFKQDLHNVMSYNNCDHFFRLTSHQAQMVRKALYNNRGMLVPNLHSFSKQK